MGIRVISHESNGYPFKFRKDLNFNPTKLRLLTSVLGVQRTLGTATRGGQGPLRWDFNFVAQGTDPRKLGGGNERQLCGVNLMSSGRPGNAVRGKGANENW